MPTPSDLPDRACKNWIKTFLDWTLPASESPESFLIWSGLFCLSAVTKKHIRFGKEYTRKYSVYPTTYLMFVAPPGVARKTSTLDYANDLLTGLNLELAPNDPSWINFGPSAGSTSAIIERMSKTQDGSLVILAGEFGNLVSIQPEITYDFYSKMFDQGESYEYLTRAHQTEIIENPNLNIFGCTTPEWFSNNAEYMMGGGMAARTVFIFETKARQRKLFYDDISTSLIELDEMRTDLIHDLKIISQIEGEFKPENKKLRDKMEDWYVAYGDIAPEKGVETFAARKHIHTLRTTMLLALCESNELVVRDSHFEAALILIHNVEKKLSRGFATTNKNPYIHDHFEILDYIKRNSPVKRSQVLGAFWQGLPGDAAKSFSDILEILLATGEIEEFTTGGIQYLRKRDPSEDHEDTVDPT